LLDSSTLRVTFGVSALTLFLLFALVTYRHTRSPFSFWWSAALALFMGGSLAYLLDGTPGQVWANPLGNGLIVAGAASTWMGSRSLRGLPTPWSLVVAPTALVVAVSSVDSPATNDWSGGALYLALMCTLIALSTRELVLLDAGLSRTRWPLITASGALSLYYAVRFVVFLASGPRSDLFMAWFGTPSTTLITLVLLVVVSFSMASLSGEQVARMFAARAARSRQELVDGGGVQRRLLPQTVPDLPGYDVAGSCVPSGAVSGDFFDWKATPDGLVVTLADVMGKGVGAAMIAATVRAALRVASPAHDPAVHAYDAGHGLGVVCRVDGTRESVPSLNLPLGAFGTQRWATSTVRLDPGDLLLICSDGVLDLFDGTLASMDTAALTAMAAEPTADAAVRSLTRLAAEGTPPDDVTVVAIRRTHDAA
jgi:sigma-B regulation protein RsbU (phosphoserine phosphatase)